VRAELGFFGTSASAALSKQAMLATPAAEEFNALKEALAIASQEAQQARQHSEALEGELRMVRAERDLLRERLNQSMRKLFAARSEAGSAQQRDLFFNEAELLGAASELAACDSHEEDTQEVRAHQRVPRGRKPLDAALPREVVRHELPESERVCPHDGAALVEIGVEASEQLDIIPQQVRVIRHERVKYACPCCDGGLRLASKPAQVIP